jgi:hypothetical protein
MARQSEDRNGAHDDGKGHKGDTADDNGSDGETQAERLRRRAAFLRDLAEMKELRARVRPRRTRLAKLREARRRATYRSS